MCLSHKSSGERDGGDANRKGKLRCKRVPDPDGRWAPCAPAQRAGTCISTRHNSGDGKRGLIPCFCTEKLSEETDAMSRSRLCGRNGEPAMTTLFHKPACPPFLAQFVNPQSRLRSRPAACTQQSPGCEMQRGARPLRPCRGAWLNNGHYLGINSQMVLPPTEASAFYRTLNRLCAVMMATVAQQSRLSEC